MGKDDGERYPPHQGCSHYAALADPAARSPEDVLASPAHVGRRNPQRPQGVWDRFYSLRFIWQRSRLTFILISKIYRQMYADTGIATDSARIARSARWAR